MPRFNPFPRVSSRYGATYSGRYGSDWSQLVRLRRTRG